MPKKSMRDALREALHEEMERDDSIIVLGEDVIAHGGPYAVTRGIDEKFPGRIRQTPISEAGIVGTALGAALCGMRPVAEVMYVDFATCAMDEVVNQMAKVRYMFGGQTDVPVVLRLPSGSGAPAGGPALAVPGGVVPARARPAGGGALDGVRRQGPAEDRPARQGPRIVHGSTKRLYTNEGRGAGRGLRHPVRTGGREAGRARRDHRGHRADGAEGAGSGWPAGPGRHRGRGGGYPHAGAVRQGDGVRLGRKDQPGDRHRRGGEARRAPAPRSPR